MGRENLTDVGVGRAVDRWKLAGTVFAAERLAFIQAEQLQDRTVEAQVLLQTVAEQIQNAVHKRIAGVVSKCLAFVFDEPYEFSIVFEKKRGKTEAVLMFSRDGLELTDPLGEIGGGVVNVAAFALRLACLSLERPVKRRLLVLDEPFSGLRGERQRERMRTLLESLADEFGVQFVLNIDGAVFPEFLLGKVVEVGT